MIPKIPLRRALSDPNILGGVLVGPSWDRWRALLLSIVGEDLREHEAAIWRELTGRGIDLEPHGGRMAREFVAIIGRRGGKDQATAVLACWIAGCCTHPELARGEVGTVVIVAADRNQANVQLGYIKGALESSPMLSKMVEASDAESVTLRSGIKITVRSSSYRLARGMTCVAIVASEVAFWHSEESSRNPDREIIEGLRPALLTTGGPLVLISSPHSKSGYLWEVYKKHFGPKGDPRVIVAQASTKAMNPTADQEEINRALRDDPAAGAANYLAQFQDGLSAFIPRAIVEACVIRGRRELAPMPDMRYVGFVDPSGGSSDSMCAAIAHRSGDTVILDAVMECRPPFSPDAVVRNFADMFSRYAIGSVRGDNYGAAWVTEAFTRHRITYEKCDRRTSELYLEFLPQLNSRKVELLDNPRLIDQVASLERSTASGRDRVDHAPGLHDDLACVVAGATFLAGTASQRDGIVSVGGYGMSGKIEWDDERTRPRLRLVPRSENDREAERRRDKANAEHQRRHR